MADTTTPVSTSDLSETWQLLFGTSLTPDDIDRWLKQAIVFADSPGCRFGLAQSNGGPCGVLAALGGFALREMLFGAAFGDSAPEQDVSKRQRTNSSGEAGLPSTAATTPVAAACTSAATAAPGTPPPSSTAAPEVDASLMRAACAGADAQERAVVLAMRRSLWQAAQATGQPAVVVLCEAEHLPCDLSTPAEAFSCTLCSTEAETEVALQEASLYYQTPSGVILFVLSLLLSRGCGGVKQDMDEPDTCLVQRFGHCSQELLNLAMTGRATSGVFDGTKSLAEDMGAAGAELGDVPGLSMKGVLQQPSLGYLTQLEALRYTSVGTHFKEPAWPIYVLASTSHYSLLFALEHTVIQPSPSAIARRAFDAADASGGGMIQADALQGVLKSTQLNTAYAGRLSQSPFHKVANDAAQLQRLRSALDSGGIILWADFWRAVRPVCTGDSEEIAVPAGAAGGTDTDPTAVSDAPASFTIPPGGFPGKREWVQAVFSACDSGGGQFLTEADAKKALQTLSFTPAATDASREQLWSSMNALTDGMGVVFFDVFFTAVEGTLAEPPPPTPVPAPSVPLVRSDSEFARSLQEAEYGPTEGGAGIPAVAGAAAAGGGSASSGDFEAPSLRELTLYHFSGLSTGSRGPRCVRLRLKQPDAGGSAAAEAEAFAQLGSLEAILLQGMAEHEGGLQGEDEGGSREALAKQRQKDLEAMQSVLRTKWSGATVVACDQLVQPAPIVAESDAAAPTQGPPAPPGVDAACWGKLRWLSAAPPKID